MERGFSDRYAFRQAVTKSLFTDYTLRATKIIFCQVRIDFDVGNS